MRHQTTKNFFNRDTTAENLPTDFYFTLTTGLLDTGINNVLLFCKATTDFLLNANSENSYKLTLELCAFERRKKNRAQFKENEQEYEQKKIVNGKHRLMQLPKQYSLGSVNRLDCVFPQKKLWETLGNRNNETGLDFKSFKLHFLSCQMFGENQGKKVT